MVLQQGDFSEKLQELVGANLQVKINDNVSTMLSVKWSNQETRVSIHKMFVQAPQDIQQLVASYIRREVRKLDPRVKAFIETNGYTINSMKRIAARGIGTEGRYFNLQEMVSKLNALYFNNTIRINISWFGKHEPYTRSRVIFGEYFAGIRLIVINRLLDHIDIPKYVIEYVVFHEMVHVLCPAYVDSSGRHHIHTREFIHKERSYPYYLHARKWIKDNLKRFFIGRMRRVRFHGRT